MITDNKKLIKEINTIIASSTKAMEITKQEIEKVDAKYRALADKEKADLEKLLRMQEGQISAYKAMVCFTDEPEAPVVEETANKVVEEAEKEPVEEKVVDTIFPENNEEETSEEETSEAEAAEPETASESKPENAETSEWETSESQEINDDDDWGDEPEEWK